MSLISFPEPKDLEVAFIDRTGDSRAINLNPYGVDNPHPGFGKDPNILNEYGHTKYPMWVNGKIVNNEEEENALRNPPASVPAVEVPNSDTTKQNGW